MTGDPTADTLRRLVDRHRYAREAHLPGVLLLHFLKRWLELLTVAAPGRPEFQHNWRLAEQSPELDALAIERLEGGVGRNRADRDATVLRACRGRT
jgi:hypothetical protein